MTINIKKIDNSYVLRTYNNSQMVEWFTFYWRKKLNFEITYSVCGYFENRPNIRISLLYFTLLISLPFTNSWTDECVPPKYGIAIYDNTLWIYIGGKGNLNGGNKWITWDIPFFTMNWYRTSILLKDDTWEHESKNNRKSFYNEEWKDKQKVYTYEYLDKYDNTLIPTKIYVEKREWRPKWLTWTSLFAKVSRDIDVHFSKEVGKGKGSWKGGTIGRGYRMLPNETPLDTIKRMEIESNY